MPNLNIMGKHLKKLFLALGVVILTIEAVHFSIATVKACFYPVPYSVWTPLMERYFLPAKGGMPGIEGVSKFTTNSLGIRGDEFDSAQTYRILVLGGSTTECLYLDDEETWPKLLQKKLCENGIMAWVGNVARSGYTTNQNLLQMKYLLPQYPKMDVLILMAGANDMWRGLRGSSESGLTDDQKTKQELADAFSDYPGMTLLPNGRSPFYKKTGTWQMLRKIKKTFFISHRKDQVQDVAGLYLDERRRRRQNATVFRERLPDLSSGIYEYTENINRMIDLAKSLGIRIIFLTQPTQYADHLPAGIEKLLWGGAIEPSDTKKGEYFSAAAIEKAIEIYNQALIEVCRRRGVECIDLAQAFPKGGALVI